MNVQGFPGDGAPHDRVAILPVEKDHVAPENEALHGRWECQVVRFQAPLHAAYDKDRERMDVHLDTGAVQGA